MPKRLPVQFTAEQRRDAAVWYERLGGGAGRKATIPSVVGEAAWEGYAADGHGSQSCERLHQRGGFGLGELGYYIARGVEAGRVEIRVVRPDSAGSGDHKRDQGDDHG